MSRSQLEAAYRGAIDRQMLEQLDEPWDIPCGSHYHGSHSNHGGPAAFLQLGPCEHASGFRCAMYVNTWRRDANPGVCDTCGCTCEFEAMTFIPLAEAHS